MTRSWEGDTDHAAALVRWSWHMTGSQPLQLVASSALVLDSGV
jgi:hypothetical protein